MYSWFDSGALTSLPWGLGLKNGIEHDWAFLMGMEECLPSGVRKVADD